MRSLEDQSERWPLALTQWTEILAMDRSEANVLGLRDPAGGDEAIIWVEPVAQDIRRVHLQVRHESDVESWEYDAGCGCRICSAYETMSFKYPSSQDFRQRLLDAPDYLWTIVGEEE